MKKLQTNDIFAGCRLIKKLGVKEEIKELALRANRISEEEREGLGFDFILSVFDKAVDENNEKAIYDFLARFFECEPVEIAEMDPVEMLANVIKVASIDRWKAFFTSVARLIAKN